MKVTLDLDKAPEFVAGLVRAGVDFNARQIDGERMEIVFEGSFKL